MKKRLATLLYDLPAAVAATVEWLPPLVARVTVGWVFLQTGWGKLHALDGVIAFFADLGIPYPELQAPFVATTELVGGALLVVGLLTRFAAVPLAITMVVAIATAQWASVSSAAGLFGLVEVLYVALFLWLAIAGPGRLSLDHWLERALRPREPEPYVVRGGVPVRVGS